MARLYLFIIICGIIGGGGYLAYHEYLRMQEKIVLLETQKAQLKEAVREQEEAFEALQNSYASAQTELTSLNEAYADIRRQNQQLANKLQTLDLTAAAIANPEGIGRAVNRGTENAGRCFELLSGALLTEDEKNAKTDKAFNKECPWLYDSYKSRGLLNVEAGSSGTDRDID